MSLLGIDVGTTGCKAAAFSEDGTCLADAYREYPTCRPQADWAELDSQHVWQCVKTVIGHVAANTTADPVTALCVSSMGETMTPVSSDRRILGNGILCTDPRGAQYADQLRQSIPQQAFYRINPNIIGPQYAMPKLRWVKEHQPDLWGRAHKFLLWSGLVGFLLGGDPITDYSLANRTLLFDIQRQDWSPKLLEQAQIEPDKLPRPRPSGTVAGTVTDAVADELGLPKNVQIVAGGHDQCCNALGAGICSAGRAVCGIGTYECIAPVYDRLPDGEPMLASGLNIEHHVLPGLYVTFLYNHSGSLVRWFRDTFAAADVKLLADPGRIYDVLSREMPDRPTRLFTLPYFDVTGPPEFVNDASGVITGLRMTTTRGEILKSIMESVTFYLAESVNTLKGMGIDTSEFIATGGGARSDHWLQIKADVFGVPFVRPKITEGTVLGAAMLAGIATKRFASPQQAVSRFVARDRIFEPDAERHALYTERLARYRQLFPLLREFLKATP